MFKFTDCDLKCITGDKGPHPHLIGSSEAIFLIREQRILLDADLALIYRVPTKVLNQAVKRNVRRFPSDFVFRLTAEELDLIRMQIANRSNRSQIVTGSQKHRDLRFLPYAFTAHGAIMLQGPVYSNKATDAIRFLLWLTNQWTKVTIEVGGVQCQSTSMRPKRISPSSSNACSMERKLRLPEEGVRSLAWSLSNSTRRADLLEAPVGN